MDVEKECEWLARSCENGADAAKLLDPKLFTGDISKQEAIEMNDQMAAILRAVPEVLNILKKIQEASKDAAISTYATAAIVRLGFLFKHDSSFFDGKL